MNGADDPYYKWSDADERALKKFTHNTFGGSLGKLYFTWKKAAYKDGLIQKVDMGRLRTREKEAARATEAGRRAIREQALNSEGETDTEDIETEEIDDPEEIPIIDITGNKRPRETTTDMVLAEGPMDTGDGETTTLALRSAGMAAGEGVNGTGETPVNLSLPRELGMLTETRTTILPITFGVSMCTLYRTIGPNFLKIRMNAPYNILKDSAFVAQAENGAQNSGLTNCQAMGHLPIRLPFKNLHLPLLD